MHTDVRVVREMEANTVPLNATANHQSQKFGNGGGGKKNQLCRVHLFGGPGQLIRDVVQDACVAAVEVRGRGLNVGILINKHISHHTAQHHFYKIGIPLQALSMLSR